MQTGNKRLFTIEAIKRGNKIINNILAKHKNPNFSKDLEMKLMMIVLNFFNIFCSFQTVVCFKINMKNGKKDNCWNKGSKITLFTQNICSYIILV